MVKPGLANRNCSVLEELTSILALLFTFDKNKCINIISQTQVSAAATARPGPLREIRILNS